MQPLDLIRTARRLVQSDQGDAPRQSDLKRAMSTAYYAMFHELCRNCADRLIGGQGSDRSSGAWWQIYRAVEHNLAKNQCRNKNILARFPEEIQNFADLFVTLQVERQLADYDPNIRLARAAVVRKITAAESTIGEFRKVKVKHRCAFAAWTIVKSRGDPTKQRRPYKAEMLV